MTKLILNRGTIMMTREEIADIPEPIATKTFKPIPHIELIQELTNALKEEKIEILDEKFGVSKKGKMLFGIIKINHILPNNATDGVSCLGLRQANNKSMSIQIYAGFSVIVCDNLFFSEDMIALRRHTSKLELKTELIESVKKLKLHLANLDNKITELKNQKIDDKEARAIMHEIFANKFVPVKLLIKISQCYFVPQYKEFVDKTKWSLLNAFTNIMKSMPIITRSIALQKLGKYFSLSSPVAPKIINQPAEFI